MSRKVLGLEIRKESVAAVLLNSGFKGNTLEGYGYFPIPVDSVGDEGIQQAMRSLVETMKIGGAACILGIPTDAISFRNLTLPFLSTKKIRQILPFEMEPSLPVPVEELIFDFEAVKGDGGQNLLGFAVHKAQVQRYIDILHAVSLKPITVMPAGYAAARFISTMNEATDDFLFIDSGSGNHTIYAVCSGAVRMIRTLPMTGGQNPVVHTFEPTLRRTFTALHESTGISVSPSTIYSAGPQAGLLMTGSGSPTLMDVPVTTAERVRADSRLKGDFHEPDWLSGRLDIALSLAMMESEAISGINFFTNGSKALHLWGEYKRSIILTAVLIMLTLTAGVAGQFMDVRAKERQLSDLDRQIEAVFKSTFPGVTRIVDPLQQMRVKIKSAADNSIGLDFSTPRVRIIDILNALSQKIPSTVDVRFTRMVVGIDNVVISGNTETFNTVDGIKGRLENADIFKSVIISSADLEKSGKRVRFKLKLEF